jgi:hypothetical protein
MVRHDKRSKGCEIRYELVESLPVVEVVEDELTQVCINLALNAFDAMAANPADWPRRLTIRSEASRAVVRVSFRDTGPGVPQEIRSKLFQPFFTTKEAGQGMGLGLSVSYRILEEHAGMLWLTGPRARRRLRPSSPTTAVTFHPVVDDEPPRSGAGRGASGSRRARPRCWRRPGGRPRAAGLDLCLSDIRMPAMAIDLPGLLEVSPETMVILMTAHGELDTAIEASARGPSIICLPSRTRS